MKGKSFNIHINKLAVILGLMFVTNISSASTVTAIASGDWTANENWDLGVAPGCYDTIIIPAGITIDVDDQIDLSACPSTFIWIQGELHFITGKKLDLPCGSTVYMDPGPPMGTITTSGGGGSSNLISICATTVWTTGDGELTGPDVLCIGCTLPIELLYFSANLKNETVILCWETASETNNAYFTIERSYDGVTWFALTTVDGAGNSTSAIQYNEQDRKPLYGLSYYRLKQTDFDGNYTYSKTVAVDRNGGLTRGELNIFPNPISQNNDVTIFLPEDSESPAVIEIMSLDGKIIYQKTYDLFDNVEIVITIDYSFEPGTYIVKSEFSSAKLVIR